MPPIAEGEKVFDLPDKQGSISLKYCLEKLLNDENLDLYESMGAEGFRNLIKPLREFIKRDKKYAEYISFNIDKNGRVKYGKIKTYEEWRKLKNKRKDTIRSLEARADFAENARDPKAGTTEELVYGK